MPETSQPSIPALATQKLAAKIFVEQGQEIPLEVFANIFHSWIQQQNVADHLLIDVADYKHVIDGPGMVLISHEANIYVDETEGRRGLLYVRKMPLAGSFAKRTGQIIGYALGLAHRLEQEPALEGKLKFDPSQLLFRINDRLHLRNTAEAFEQLQPVLIDSIGGALGNRHIKLTHSPDSEKLFEVQAIRG